MKEIDEMLAGGAVWAIDRGFGFKSDLDRIEEHGIMKGAEPKCVSDQAKKRQQDEVGTLGSGNHYMEVQEVKEIYDEKIAQAFGIGAGRYCHKHTLRLAQDSAIRLERII